MSPSDTLKFLLYPHDEADNKSVDGIRVDKTLNAVFIFET